jgi:hypothetical protein
MCIPCYVGNSKLSRPSNGIVVCLNSACYGQVDLLVVSYVSN